MSEVSMSSQHALVSSVSNSCTNSLLHYFPERDTFFLKQAQRRDSENPPKSHSKQDDQPEQTERGRERLSAENGEERHRRKDKKGRSHSRSHSCDRWV